MKIPSYWAEYTLAFHNPNSRKADKTSHIKRFGWSDISVDEAKRHAVERCEQARQAYKNKSKGEKVNFAEGIQNYDETPIREEVLQRYDELNCVATINSYGATCLNVEDVMILDVDDFELEWRFQQHFNSAYKTISHSTTEIITVIVFFCLLGYGLYISFEFSLLVACFVCCVLLLLLGLIFDYINTKRRQKWLLEQGGHDGMLIRFLNQFLKQEDDFSVNIYETPIGFRLIVLHNTFTVNDEVFKLISDSLPIDKRYATMCKVQQCYRARVTGKPWRMGIVDKPSREFWKNETADDEYQLRHRVDWLKNYNDIAPNYRACQFVKRVGNMDITIHPKVAKVVALHDDLCQSDKELPLA